MEHLLVGFQNVLTPVTLFWVTVGVTLGYVLGALPGLGKATGVAVAIPMTFYLQPVAAIALLIGIAKGSAAGSAVSAILLNTPGEPSSAPTALDGYPLARQGKAQKALKMGLFASVIGDFLSTLVLIALAAPLARYALLIGPVELCAILLFSLTFIGGLAGRSMLKGLIAAAFGVFFATIGIETETFIPRMTFGLLELDDGISLVPMAIGMLAISEMVIQAGNAHRIDSEAEKINDSSSPDDRRVTLAEWRRCLPVIGRGTLIGSVVGILPGLGASVGSFLSYGATQRSSKTPEEFGTGMIEGVAAAESADNAVVPASFVPLFALGIPGSVIAAILISALVLHGLTPGPMMFIEQPQMVADLYAAMLCASLVLLIVGYTGQRIFAQIIRVPIRMIIPVVLFLCCVGAYMDTNTLFSVYVMLGFALLGYFARKLDFSFVTFLIGFVIGPNLELTFRQSLQILDHDVMRLSAHPIAIGFAVLTVVTVFWINRTNSRLAAQKVALDVGTTKQSQI
ncbi:tripartite tricarboxylate transporter permease [Sulfitobacter pseudonitzschiae]|uniref:Tripartite tricarboxylate transporter permease n=2 Tax=Roseobacteraceae TaxID=2854170 RepID=A0A9Q2RWV9_9RHOB|nr:tripartite tricarboxylate transporter permease [Pseudosulfitobacter pseudonitzschiae]MBM2294336.1 tripartite tricarboxylate transporter permease [Pseudosulfitobacter pseudonitzschiae]MBM2299261.1 tripartite tricarboxylate transporter permease [Pseudosulfitobacter pseudonitzschiae]MBM2304169.1 tripartite tricarboxylate transporter permease [Pseudosulfitobacter pseudonitzschiae]MBM2313949.1 tripartite tricarboxylate transporter permease [Pseudosulfitobacter pseudonitzschiae]MBM2318863.1 tripa